MNMVSDDERTVASPKGAVINNASQIMNHLQKYCTRIGQLCPSCVAPPSGLLLKHLHVIAQEAFVYRVLILTLNRKQTIYYIVHIQKLTPNWAACKIKLAQCEYTLVKPNEVM